MKKHIPLVPQMATVLLCRGDEGRGHKGPDEDVGTEDLPQPIWVERLFLTRTELCCL